MAYLKLLALTGAGFLAGCGSASNTTRSTGVVTTAALPAPSLVTERQVNAASPGSPERAAVKWWQAMQYDDALTAISLTSPSAVASIKGAAQFRQIVAVAGPSLSGFRPKSTTKLGNRAVVRGMQLSYASPPSRRLVAQYPVSVILAKSGGGWKVDDLATVVKLYQLVIGQQSKSAG